MSQNTSPSKPAVTQVGTRSAIKTALGSLGRSPAFVVAGAILLVAAIGLNGATQALSLNFRKQAMALRASVATLPKDLGPWRQVSRDMPLSGDMEHVLGTEKYIFRDFVDTRRVSPEQLAAFKDKDANECARLVEQIRRGDPRAIMKLSVTYYTGMVDTVAHIPDRCFVADGYQPTTQLYPRWKLGTMQFDDQGYHLDAAGNRVSDPSVKAAGGDQGLPVRFINFEDQDNRGQTRSCSVTYTFLVNGRYEANPLGVRQTLQNLMEKYGYYAKVELMTTLRDTDVSEATNSDFLSFALPELEKCFPDWASRAQNGRASEGGPVAAK